MMFPDARNSLRRWSVASETKIPIPVAITLHNFILPTLLKTNDRYSSVPLNSDNGHHDEHKATNGSSIDDLTIDRQGSHESDKSTSKEEDSRWLHRQPQHNNNLLPPISLQITVTETGDSDGGGSPTVVYSQHSSRERSIHPSWEHLDERISVENKPEWWDQNELYKSMKVTLSIEVERESKLDRDSSTQDADHETLLEACLHPSFLKRIDIKPESGNTHDEDGSTNSLLPPALPPNAMLVYFSDGSIRCPAHTFQVLWDHFGHSHGILEPPPIEDFSRFEDDVFSTLDHVQQTPQRPRGRSVSSLLDQEQDSNQRVHATSLQAARQGETSHPTTPEREPDENCNEESENCCNQQEAYANGDRDGFCYSELDMIKAERRQEKIDLLRRIADEEQGLEEDISRLNEEKEIIRDLMEEIHLLERDIKVVKKELHQQTVKWKRDEMMKEAQSMKLFWDLKDIYPITINSVAQAQSDSEENEKYLIRGLRLPMDIYTTTIVEEEVNTSLGFCAHLVFMMAKYLAIQLRHRIYCNGSRSAVELEGVGVFPLFMGRLAARALEREQVDRGARLLGANVDCIMMHLGLLLSTPSSSSEQSHILKRIQTILEFVAEGRRDAMPSSQTKV